jgi:molybdopterin-guanine dinucleotide biosynthesis protein A
MTTSVLILLAGGKSSRYNRSLQKPNTKIVDKLLTYINDKTLLEHVISQIAGLTDEIIIVTRGEKRKSMYEQVLSKTKESYIVKVITEQRKTPIGPLGGICTALEFDNSNYNLTLPADLPLLERNFVESLIKRTINEKYELSTLFHPFGQVEHLILALKGNNIKKYCKQLFTANIYRTSSLIRLIPNKQFINLNSFVFQRGFPQILIDLDIENQKESRLDEKYDNPSIKEPNILFNDDLDEKNPSYFFTKYLQLKEEKVKLLDTKIMLNYLINESKIYEKAKLFSLSLHCLLDAQKINKNDKIAKKISLIKKELAT